MSDDPRPKAIPWRGGDVDFQHDRKRVCPFILEIERNGKRRDLDCRGNSVISHGAPAVCICIVSDSERGDVCPLFWHMLGVPLDLAINCCWEWQMLITRCASWRTSYGKKQLYVQIRHFDWGRDVHRCYEEPTPRYCPFCGAEIKHREFEQ